MSFGKALYFPYIHFQNEDWLKYTLLYWDGVKRIVPRSYYPEDSEAVKILVDAGVIESVDPQSGEMPYTEGTAKEFIPTLESLMKARQHVRTGAPIKRKLEDNSPYSLIHIEKISRVLSKLMQSHGARLVHDDDWLSMDDDIAGHYMLCLAAHIGEKQNLPLLSDSREIETAGTYFQHSRVTEAARPDTQGDTGFTLARMVLPVPCPQALSNVPMKQVLRFHTQHEAERMQFRTAVETLTKEAAALTDTAAVRDLLEQQKKRIANALVDQRKAFDEFGVGVGNSLMAISAPAGLTALTAQVTHDPVVTGTVAGVGLALAFVGWVAKTRQDRRKLMRGSDWHYLLTLERVFDSAIAASEPGQSYKQFVLG